MVTNKHIYVNILREGDGTPLQYSCLENPMDGGAWWAAVHGVTRSRTRLRDFTLFFHFHALEKEMATHSSVLAWRIRGTGEPGGLPSMGSQRVGHDWCDLAVAAAAACKYTMIVYFYKNVMKCNRAELYNKKLNLFKLNCVSLANAKLDSNSESGSDSTHTAT